MLGRQSEKGLLVCCRMRLDQILLLIVLGPQERGLFVVVLESSCWVDNVKRAC